MSHACESCKQRAFFRMLVCGLMARIDDVAVDFGASVAREVFESGPPGDNVKDALASLDFPDRRGNSVFHKSNSCATIAAELSWRALSRVVGSQPRTSSSIRQSSAMVANVCVGYAAYNRLTKRDDANDGVTPAPALLRADRQPRISSGGERRECHDGCVRPAFPSAHPRPVRNRHHRPRGACVAQRDRGSDSDAGQSDPGQPR